MTQYEQEKIVEIEANIAILIAKLLASRLFVPDPDANSLFGMPVAMIPSAYAFIEVLVRAGCGAVCEPEWHNFLRGALDDVISKHRGHG